MRFSLPRCPTLGVAFLLALAAAASPLGAMDHSSARPFDPRVFAATETPGGLAPGSFVPNFRLTDHTGTSRELYYESTTKAVVLVFTATGGPRALQTASALRALRARFAAADVTLWQIDSNLAADRAAITAEQTLFNNPVPVLIDEAQLVASELGVTRQLEVLVIDPVSLVLSYRGPLDNADPASLAAPTQNFAADAVAALVAGRAPAAGQRIAMSPTAPALDLPAPSVPDYAAEVAPIVLARCVSCHSPGNIAPHVYRQFADLAAKAPAIRQSLLAKRMAPWHADSRYGVFENTAALSPAEASTLYHWVRAGAPRGTSASDPLSTTPAPAGGDWPLGPPDLILSLPKKTLPATGSLPYDYPELTLPTTEDKWLRAVYVKPGNRRAVHHALVLEGSQVEQVLAVLSGNLPGLTGFYAGYVPGLDQTWFPDGSGKLLRRASKLTVQMHYTTTGQPESDETQLGFYYASRAPDRELFTKSANNTNLTIPAGAKDYEREASFTASATKDVMLYELNPHMHYRGKRVRFDALYPDGTTETLLNVPAYDFNWQSQYRLAQPKRLPAGTAIRVRGAFDNSAQNPANPNPNATVRFGEQTSDEMFIGYINYAELSDKITTAKPPLFAATSVARARVGEPFRFALEAANAPTAYRAASLPAGLTLDARTGVLDGTPTSVGRRAVTIIAENAAGAAATVVDLVVSAATAAPVFTLQPKSVRTTIGANVTLVAAATGFPKPTYTWLCRGQDFCNTTEPVLELTNITAAYVGDFTCVATNAAGTATSAPATLSLEFSGLVNLSARANVGTGANVVIPGITIRGTKPKTLLIRAAGPALGAFGVPGTLANPVVTVFDSANQPILVNDNWGNVPDVSALKAASAAQGAFALTDGSRDAALLVTLPPGGYTIQVAGVGTGTATSGVALVEVYEADATPSTLVNLSCRARVGTGADVLAAGFVIRGTAPRRLLIRGVGPTLAGFGVAGTLADPKLEIIRQGETSPLATNDNWSTPVSPLTSGAAELNAAFTSVGAFALTTNSRDAALIVTLPPGTYTAQVSGLNNTVGVAIVEVYDLP